MTKPKQTTRGTVTHRNKYLTVDAESIDDFIKTYEDIAAMMRTWRDAGLVYVEGAEDDHAHFSVPDNADTRELFSDKALDPVL